MVAFFPLVEKRSVIDDCRLTFQRRSVASRYGMKLPKRNGGFESEASTVSDSSPHKRGRISIGYQQSSQVEVTVYKGTSAVVDVDFTMNSVTSETLNAWWEKVRGQFTSAQIRSLQKVLKSGGTLSDFLQDSFGMIFGIDSSTRQFDKINRSWEVKTKKQEIVSQSIYSLAKIDVRVSGKIRASCLTDEPVRASVFVRVTDIVFSDGASINAFNSANPVVADVNGDTTKVTYEPTTLIVSHPIRY
jgi:hypothetical protein